MSRVCARRRGNCEFRARLQNRVQIVASYCLFLVLAMIGLSAVALVLEGRHPVFTAFESRVAVQLTAVVVRSS